jgi:chromosome segregation ATPase
MPQIFIISHKEDVISMCDSLIGVTQDDITKLVANQG